MEEEKEETTTTDPDNNNNNNKNGEMLPLKKLIQSTFEYSIQHDKK